MANNNWQNYLVDWDVNTKSGYYPKKLETGYRFGLFLKRARLLMTLLTTYYHEGGGPAGLLYLILSYLILSVRLVNAMESR